MKKVSTATAKQGGNIFSVETDHRTGKALQKGFSAIPRSRVAATKKR
jgi:hypothetical protein